MSDYIDPSTGDVNEVELRKAVEQGIEHLVVAGRIHKFKREPRCKVCRQEHLVPIINAFLVGGFSYNKIMEKIAPFQPEKEKDKIGYNSIRNHHQRHLTEESAASMVHREILERNAKKREIDFVDGVVSAITPMAYMESVMTKGYKTLVDDNTFVSAELGLKAAEKLHEIHRSEEENENIDDIIYKMNLLTEIVREVVPVKYWNEITARLAEEEEKQSGIVNSEAEEDIDDAEVVEDEPQDFDVKEILGDRPQPEISVNDFVFDTVDIEDFDIDKDFNV